MGRVVLVTGVANEGAAAFARHLVKRGADEGIEKVVGVDTTLPGVHMGGAKFIRADIRTPVIGKVIAVEDVDTVVHLAVKNPKRHSSSSKELNVIGTMQLLAACQGAPGLKKLVLGSSTAVYGASPRDPAVWRESNTARGGVKSGYPKEVVEVESYTRGFARRRPDVTVTTLRLAQILAAKSDDSFAQYFRAPALPSVLGFDPRLQFIHPDDAFEAMSLAVLRDHAGTFNMAGPGVLTLSQAALILGKPWLPMPPIGTSSLMRRAMRIMGTDISPNLHRVLTFGRVVDTSAFAAAFGFTPTHTTRETFEEFAASLRPGILHLGGMPR